MSNLVEKGKLLYGYADKDGNLHYDFELRLLTIRGEMNTLNILLSDYPDFDELPEMERFTIQRAVTLSETLRVGGQKLTVDEILNLASEEFTILLDAEMNLRKKRSEPTQ